MQINMPQAISLPAAGLRASIKVSLSELVLPELAVAKERIERGY